jgi:hypothetical protein
MTWRTLIKEDNQGAMEGEAEAVVRRQAEEDVDSKEVRHEGKEKKLRVHCFRLRVGKALRKTE